jgi:cytidylate kinase
MAAILRFRLNLSCDPVYGEWRIQHDTETHRLKALQIREDAEMPLITITESLGSGGPVIARKIAEALQLDLYDDDGLRRVALDLGIRSDELEGLSEKAPGFWDRVWSKGPELFLYLMEEIIYEIAKRGKGVILGHGSQLLLREFHCALHVRVFASESFRVQRLAQESGISRQAAEKMVRKTDSERQGFLSYAYQMDWNDPTLYDLLVNTEKLGLDFGAKLVVEAAGSQQVEECSAGALQAMARYALAKKIEAELLRKYAGLTRVYVEVPEKGVAVVSGWTDDREHKAEILDTVRAVPGVSEVRDEMMVAPTTWEE